MLIALFPSRCLRQVLFFLLGNHSDVIKHVLLLCALRNTYTMLSTSILHATSSLLKGSYFRSYQMHHASRSTEGGTGEGDGVLATFARNRSTTRLPRRRFDSDMRSSGRCAWSYTYQTMSAYPWRSFEATQSCAPCSGPAAGGVHGRRTPSPSTGPMGWTARR